MCGCCLYVHCVIQLSQKPCWVPMLQKGKESTAKLSDLSKATQLTPQRQGSLQACDNFVILPGHSSLCCRCAYGKGFVSSVELAGLGRSRVYQQEPWPHQSRVWPWQLLPPTWDGQKPGGASALLVIPGERQAGTHREVCLHPPHLR